MISHIVFTEHFLQADMSENYRHPSHFLDNANLNYILFQDLQNSLYENKNN